MTKDHTIKVCTMDGVWFKGTVDNLGFEMKVCDKPTDFGIDGGRIIKLRVRKYVEGKRDKELFSYERGWGKRPRGKYKDVAKAMIRFSESLPEQGIWQRTFYRKLHRFLVTDDDVLEYEQDNP